MANPLSNKERFDRLEARFSYLLRLLDSESGLCVKYENCGKAVFEKPAEEKKPPEPKPTPHHEWYIKEFPDRVSCATQTWHESARCWDASRRQAVTDVIGRLKWFDYKESARIIENHDWGTDA